MRLAVMQPYFFPYIGYFQLIGSVDAFIIYDDVKYTKKGWINRNRILVNGRDAIFSLPLRGGSDSLSIREREIAGDFDASRLLGQLAGAYKKAPYYDQTMPLVEDVLCFRDKGLFAFLCNSIRMMCNHLNLTTDILTSSEVALTAHLKSQEKVVALCRELNADVYINPIGGVSLYDKEEFIARGLQLHFLASKPHVYKQFDQEFVPWLSIIDILMFNSLSEIRELLVNGYSLE